MLPSTSQRLLGGVNRQQIQFVLCPICRAESTTVTPPPLLPVPSERSTKQPSYLGYLATVVSEWIPKLSTTETATKKSDISRVISKKPSRSEVSAKTRALVKKLLCAETAGSLRLRTHELTKHLSEFPPSRVVATQDAALLPFLLQNATHASDEDLIEESRQCLAQCGYVEPPRGRGVSVLAVDGGGTRGMMGLEVLEAIEKLSGRKIGELFDHIVGVSTGAVVAMLVGIKGNAVSECKRIYMDLSREIFKQSSAAGVSGLLTAHSYYNTKKWVKLLETIVGDDTMIQTARREGTPKISIVACVVNLPQLQPFIFRNYEHPSGMDSHFRGSASFRVTEAVQASAAAPGYFEEVTIGDFLLQDGGVLSNNPTAVGLHETRLLWPKDPLHCVISVGNGRTVADLEPNAIVKSTGVQQKLAKLVDSATDTELVHIAMHDLLNRGSYFRLNPYMSYTYGLDEIDPDRLYQMQLDAKNYVRRNMSKIEAATERLLQRPRLVTRLERTVYRVRSIKGW